ncbi:MAG: GAF domain-containing sensor histidine kinase, partial [Anaerolineales bacterium]|nr:GAF domain-containing sensor histidine kinase [Anaerolineales bacterium]
MPDAVDYPLLLRRMERVIEISQIIASTLDHHQLLRTIIQAAKELTEAEAASIMLADSQSGELRFEATTNIAASKMEGLAVRMDNSIAGWIFTNAQSLIVPDTSQDPRWNRNVDSKVEFTTRSILGVPLTHGGKPLGVIQALNKQTGPFNEDDITTLKTLAAQAAIAIVNARLFQQSDLISEMVHELRQPLGAIMATSSLLLRPTLPEQKRTELVRTVQRETERLTTMTTDFLDMARLESGRMRFKRDPFNLPDLIQECAEVVRPQAAGRQITLRLALDPEVTTLDSDRGKLKQVLLNLLTNAVKYNHDQGAITIATRRTPDGRRVRVSVTDTGKGIPAEAMKNLFQKFFRVPDSEGYSTGTGLGLAVAKKIVEVLGGEMNVESQLGVGST